MQFSALALVAALALVQIDGFAPSATRRPVSSISMMAKGFGAPQPKPKPVKPKVQMENVAPKPKPNFSKKVEMAPEQAEAAKKYDDLVSSGMPEYAVFFRKAGMDDWLSIGAVAVPRSEKVECAIFGNVEPLKAAAMRAYPQSKEWFEAGEGNMEYGFNLAQFPDEPIKYADPEVYQREVKTQSNPIAKWMSALTNPVATNP